MKRQFILYSLSRAVLSLVLAAVVLGFTWKAAALGGCIYFTTQFPLFARP